MSSHPVRAPGPRTAGAPRRSDGLDPRFARATGGRPRGSALRRVRKSRSGRKGSNRRKDPRGLPSDLRGSPCARTGQGGPAPGGNRHDPRLAVPTAAPDPQFRRFPEMEGERRALYVWPQEGCGSVRIGSRLVGRAGGPGPPAGHPGASRAEAGARGVQERTDGTPAAGLGDALRARSNEDPPRGRWPSESPKGASPSRSGAQRASSGSV